MSDNPPRCHLGCILDSFGSHPAAWLASPTTNDCAVDFQHYLQLTRIAESAKFDFVFLADSPSLPDGDVSLLSRTPKSVNGLEPMTLLGALAATTNSIGLVATASTSYNEPYNVARYFASLDHISKGRVSWNAVTSGTSAAAYNFGRDGVAEHATRYERAGEFIDVVKGLWDSWDDDAFVLDRAQSRYFDPQKMHVLDHKGKYFKVRGPLNVSRSPQGQPLVTQAGGSDAGRELAARTADMVFTVESSLDGAVTSYRDFKSRLARYGRSPQEMKVMHGVTIVVGPSKKAAMEKLRALSDNLHEDVGRSLVDAVVGFDTSDIDYDDPIPAARLPDDSNKGKTYFNAFRRMIVDERRTVRELAAQFAEARIGNVVAGTPGEIADDLASWISQQACDGFMLRSMAFPENLLDFCNDVVPELMSRGLFRRDYQGTTLRDHLGLSRPGLVAGAVSSDAQ